jgi:NADPH2:quinone reductase
MHAVVVDEIGGPESRRLQERPEPTPGPGQVTIDVAYAGVNFADVLARASGYLQSLPFVPGLEASGHVRAVGEGVTDLTVGQPVTAFTIEGAYADVVLASAALTFAVPNGGNVRRDERPVLSPLRRSDVTPQSLWACRRRHRDRHARTILHFDGQ